jgi:hypothetical protein
VICKWQAMMARLDKARRIKVARYALRIAASLARMSSALERLEADATDRAARRSALREVGRLAGVERRLQGLAVDNIVSDTPTNARPRHIERVVAAEGYMRALADSLRT